MQYKSNPKRIKLREVFTTCYNLFLLVSTFLIEGGFVTYPLSAAQSGEAKNPISIGAWEPATITNANAENNAALPLEARNETGRVRVQGIVKAKAAIAAKTNFAQLKGVPAAAVGTTWPATILPATPAYIRLDLSGNIQCESELVLNAEIQLEFTYPTSK